MSEAVDYSEFETLSTYQKRCLVTSNFWRLINGQSEIEVPPSHTNYHEKWEPTKEKAQGLVREKELKFGKNATTQ